MPCADGEAFTALEKTTLSTQSSQHQDNNDVCSPLCFCSCCGCQGFAFTYIYSYTFIPNRISIEKKVPEYKSIITSNFYGSIWQPPQIV